MKIALSIMLCIISGWVVYGQEDKLIEEITSVLIENGREEASFQIQETIEDLLLNPINLNLASETELLECGLFNPYQVFGIMKHRNEYGDMYSIFELVQISGFQEVFLKSIQSLVIFNKGGADQNKEQYKSLLLSNFQMRLPKARAYSTLDSISNRYPGSPFKLSTRLKIRAGNRLTLACTYEKDPGERMLLNNKPEHLVGYLSLVPGEIFSKLIVGNYKIHTGMGLVNGANFNSSGIGIHMDGFSNAYSKGYSSAAESNYYRGILTELSIDTWKALIYYSYCNDDLSLYGATDSIPVHKLFETRRLSGLHRTATEIGGKDLAARQAAGISLNKHFDHLNIGISAAGARMIPNRILKDSMNMYDGGKKIRWNISASAVNYGSRYETYSEIAINEYLAYAMVMGAKIFINPAMSIHTSMHYYDPKYTGQIPGASAVGSAPSNESGFTLGGEIVPLKNMRIKLDHELAYFPSGSNKLSVPGFYSRSIIKLLYNFKTGHELYFRYNSGSRDSDSVSSEIGPVLKTTSSGQNFRIHYSYKVIDGFVLSGRIEKRLSGQPGSGMLTFQQLKLAQQRYSLTYRFTLFDIGSWENRIYCYEPGVRYSFSFPAYYGKGLKNSMVLSSKISNYLSLRINIGHVHYSHRRETGSGMETRKGDRQLDLEFQLQLAY